MPSRHFCNALSPTFMCLPFLCSRCFSYRKTFVNLQAPSCDHAFPYSRIGALHPRDNKFSFTCLCRTRSEFYFFRFDTPFQSCCPATAPLSDEGSAADNSYSRRRSGPETERVGKEANKCRIQTTSRIIKTNKTQGFPLSLPQILPECCSRR